MPRARTYYIYMYVVKTARAKQSRIFLIYMNNCMALASIVQTIRQGKPLMEINLMVLYIAAHTLRGTLFNLNIFHCDWRAVSKLA